MSNINFDFHLHCKPGSKDSKQTLSEAIKTAKEAGINTIAITDHNSLDSLDNIYEVANKENITIIPGIECSAIIKKKYQLLKM